MEKISFNIPIYGGKVLLVYSDDFLKTGRELGIEFELDINSCLGLAQRMKGRQYLILIKESRRDDPNTLVHECLHITNFILKDKGVIIDTDNDEAQAYLLGYIVERIEKLKKKSTDKKNN